MRHLHLSEVHSTNSYLRELIEAEGDSGEQLLVTAHTQIAGRGQRGNSWEAAPGQNLSLSLLLHPADLGAKHPSARVTLFDLNRVTSLALQKLLTTHYLPQHKVEVKWPNDIYVEGRKIAGILTENAWEGSHWSYTIIGVGLNVLQQAFQPYHPEATSILKEGGRMDATVPYEAWHHTLAKQVAEAIIAQLEELYADPEWVRTEYLQHLYRYQISEAPFRLPPTPEHPEGYPFRGTIIGVTPGGLLQISVGETIQQYAFKEVLFE